MKDIKKTTNKLSNGECRVIRIDRDAIYELLKETFMEEMKKQLSLALCAILFLSSTALTACNNQTAAQTRDENILRVASWDEYIDEGGEDSYKEGSEALYDEFCTWYYEQTGKQITVEYIELQDNESMYNKIKMGDSYDLLCLVGKKRGMVIRGGETDTERAANMLLEEYRNCKIGFISLERPERS